MIDLEDVPVDNLVPEALRETDSVDAYLSALPDVRRHAFLSASLHTSPSPVW